MPVLITSERSGLALSRERLRILAREILQLGALLSETAHSARSGHAAESWTTVWRSKRVGYGSERVRSACGVIESDATFPSRRVVVASSRPAPLARIPALPNA